MDIFKEKWINFFKEAWITINGSKPYDLKVNNDKFYWRLLRDGSVAFGETYMEWWWDSEDITELIVKSLNADLEKKLRIPIINQFRSIKTTFSNIQSRINAKNDVRFHYDLGTELFEEMLDKNMNYTCWYWKTAKTLDEA